MNLYVMFYKKSLDETIIQSFFLNMNKKIKLYFRSHKKLKVNLEPRS